MKGKMNKGKNFYIYLILSLILFIGSIVFYVSCQSKSPTDAAVPATETLAAKGTKSTTQTTTSSSTTTTIKPLNSASISTTIITSRNLTTTSTTTSVPSTTTTISVNLAPDVRFCYIIGNYKRENIPFLGAKTIVLPTQVTIYNGDTVYIPFGYRVNLNVYVKNIGGSPAAHVKIYPNVTVPVIDHGVRGASDAIPEMITLFNNGICKKHPISPLTASCSYRGVRPLAASCFFGEISGKPVGYLPCAEFNLKLDWEGAPNKPEFNFSTCCGYYTD
jgi:hypothetical protein